MEIRSICRQIRDLTARDHLNLYALCKEFRGVGQNHHEAEKQDAVKILNKREDPEVRQAFRDYEEHRW